MQPMAYFVEMSTKLSFLSTWCINKNPEEIDSYNTLSLNMMYIKPFVIGDFDQ